MTRKKLGVLSIAKYLGIADETMKRLTGVQRLVTHNRVAHKDDFLSACLCLAICPNLKIIEIAEKGNNIKRAIENENVMVVDIGKTHDPDHLAFDHHGLTFDDCSFSMLIKFLNLENHFDKIGWSLLPLISEYLKSDLVD